MKREDLEKRIKTLCNHQQNLGSTISQIQELLKEQTTQYKIITLPIRGAGFGFAANLVIYSYIWQDKLYLNTLEHSTY